MSDGCRQDFYDGAFDIVCPNRVLKDLRSSGRQATSAAEVRRVECTYCVQTPDFAFTVEPHLIALFIRYLPPLWQGRLYPFTGWALLYQRTRAESSTRSSPNCGC